MDGWMDKVGIFMSRYTFTRTINVNENREDRGRERLLLIFGSEDIIIRVDARRKGRDWEGNNFLMEGNKKI